MTTPKTTRKTAGKTATKQESEKAPEAESRERRIIIDLAQRIEQRGRERFAVKSENIRAWRHKRRNPIPNVEIAGRIFYRRSDLENFIEKNK